MKCLERYDESEQFLLEALAIRRQQYGDDNRFTAGTLNNIAELYREMKLYTKSILNFMKLLMFLIVFHTSLGPEHSSTMITWGVTMIYDIRVFP
jgi:hypothetical protein